jgi:uncharacterized membrane protein
MDIQTSRLLGVLGAIFMVLIIIPQIGGLLMLLGIIFLLIALKGYADTYKESAIFENALYTIVFEIIGAVVFIAILLFVALGFLSTLGITNITDFASWQAVDWQQAVNIDNILPFIAQIVIALVVLFAFTIFAALYFRKSMNALSTKTGVHLFHTTGTVFFVGAFLTIILIGFLIIWVSFVLLVISFYESKPVNQTQQPPQQNPPS